MRDKKLGERNRENVVSTVGEAERRVVRYKVTISAPLGVLCRF